MIHPIFWALPFLRMAKINKSQWYFYITGLMGSLVGGAIQPVCPLLSSVSDGKIFLIVFANLITT